MLDTRNSTDTPQEKLFFINGLNIAGKIWHADTAQKSEKGVIALHGWLDNANSFDLLAPLLNTQPLLALDLPGQGKSDFRSADAHYNIWSEIDEVLQIAELLGWQELTLLGHSRGAAVATLIAGTFPEQVNQLLLLDGGLPHPGDDLSTPIQLAKSITAKRQNNIKPATVFKTRELAISARQQGFTKVTQHAAEILAMRSLIETEDGYSWRADPRLKTPSEVTLNTQQIQAFFSNISASTLLITGSQGLFTDKPEADALFACIQGLIHKELDGRHHLHLEGAEHTIAEWILDFSAHCVEV